ncbi:MAG: YajQ family cyclic di-GMP-binding protein [Deltaproteobacteria bacterium]|nr:YajQ family cyclic di-GMP-binding protein [Deltaproteobacteria bacterium]
MPSFDIVVSTNLQEVDNAVNQARKELDQRYDFRGSKCSIDWDKKGEITLVADDDYRLKAVLDVLKTKLVRRGVSVKNLEYGEPDHAFEGTLRQKITVQEGIPMDKAKALVKAIKETKIKVQGQIREGEVRVTGKKRDDLQKIIALSKEIDLGLDLRCENFRD